MRKITLHVVKAPHGAIAFPTGNSQHIVNPPAAPIRDPWANVRKRS